MSRARAICPTETAECRTFIEWTRLVRFAGAPLFERVVKVPNERGAAGAGIAILESIGMRKGFLDYVIFAPHGRFHGLTLEAKRLRGGRVDVEQIAWCEKLRSWGYHSEICVGAQGLIAASKNYFERSGATAAGVFEDRTIVG